jgi:hypothetical protein
MPLSIGNVLSAGARLSLLEGSYERDLSSLQTPMGFAASAAARWLLLEGQFAEMTL